MEGASKEEITLEEIREAIRTKPRKAPGHENITAEIETILEGDK